MSEVVFLLIGVGLGWVGYYLWDGLIYGDDEDGR